MPALPLPPTWRPAPALICAALTFAGATTSPAGPAAHHPQPEAQQQAQQQAQPGQAQPDQGQQQQLSFDQLPAQVRLGVRVETVQRQLRTSSTVVIVPDAASYIDAVAGWSLRGRYPVLIDDGSFDAAEDIARFVRAFQPASVLRWRAPEGRADALPRGEALRAAVDAAISAAWDVEPGQLGALWKQVQHTPPGLVVMSDDDPAWTAGLALAAARGQLVVWAGSAQGVSGEMSREQADRLAEAVEEACRGSGHAWDRLGDDLEAVTLCLNVPVKIALGPGDGRSYLATTDVIGRRPPTDEEKGQVREAVPGERSVRWAWCGQVFGDEREAAYRAMCAVFLRPQRAWVFDGYEPAPPWSEWDGTAAARLLEQGEFTVLLDDTPEQDLDRWRRRAAGYGSERSDDGAQVRPVGVDAGLILVNSSGNADFFTTRPGTGKPGDVPHLSRPAIVHFVHSWSATRPGDRETVGGRWLERGAYAYIGAVHEPYLQAFQRTPIFAGRMLGSGPLGVSARIDGSGPWKVAVIGDPLITLGRVMPRTERTPPLEGALPVRDGLSAALKERRYAEAMGTLRLLGRDRDAARLAAALIKDDPDALDAPTALAGVMSAFRTGDLRTFVRLAEAATAGGEIPPALKDALWHALWPTIRTLRPEELALLKRAQRPAQAVRDAVETAEAIRGVEDADAARAFLLSVRSGLSEPDQIAELDKAIGR